MPRRPRAAALAVAEVIPDAVGFGRRREDSSTWSRRRRLIVASQCRAADIEGVRVYVRALERTLARPPRQRWAGW